MIRVTVIVDSEHHYTGIQMLGHAGLADDPRDGQELVCAAVSALTFNMSNSVEHFTEDSFEVEEEEHTNEGQKVKRRGIYLWPNLITTAALLSGFYSIIASKQVIYASSITTEPIELYPIANCIDCS